MPNNMLPKEIKKLKGTLENYRVIKNSPEPSPGEMALPESIKNRFGSISSHFDTITKMAKNIGVYSPDYSMAASLAAMRMQEIEKYSKIIEEDGVVSVTTGFNGQEQRKPHPLISARSDAMRHLHSLLVEFGLTPTGIQKVIKTTNTEDKNPFLEIMNGKS